MVMSFNQTTGVMDTFTISNFTTVIANNNNILSSLNYADLRPGTQYHFTIVAYTNKGPGPEALISVSTLPKGTYTLIIILNVPVLCFFLETFCSGFTKLPLWFIAVPSVPVTPQISTTNDTTIEMEIHQTSNLNDEIMYVVLFTLYIDGQYKGYFIPIFLCLF